MIFNKLTINDIPKLKKYLCGTMARVCDYTVGGVFIWRDYFDTYYCIEKDTLILKNTYDGTMTFSMPTGKCVDEVLSELFNHCKKEGRSLIINTATNDVVSRIERFFEIKCTPERDLSDYLYSSRNLSTFSGHKFNGQRNHINYFLNNNADYRIVPVNAENSELLIDFMRAYECEYKKDGEMFAEEIKKIREVLLNFDIYNQSGVYLEVSGEIVAFSLGEIVGDTLYVHIEKALSKYRGAYQMIVREFVKYHLERSNFEYVNREDDMGDEGIRRSKLSYHPLEIIEKFTVELLKRK